MALAVSPGTEDTDLMFIGLFVNSVFSQWDGKLHEGRDCVWLFIAYLTHRVQHRALLLPYNL